MKTQIFRKLFLSFMAIVLVMGTIVITNVHAEDSYTITINKKDEVEHTYEAYQIFDGDLYENPEDTEPRKKTLSNIEWGSGIKKEQESEILSKLKDDPTIGSKFKGCNSPREVAVVLETFNDNETDIKAFAQIIGKYLKDTATYTLNDTGENYEIKVTDPGYYLIMDKKDSLSETDYTVYTRYILEVVGNVKINPKSEKPTIEKSLSENDINDDVGDYAINEKFKYYLTAELTENAEYGEYKTYKLEFEDQMSKGITYDGDVSVIVKAHDENGDEVPQFELKNETEYTIKEEMVEDGPKLTITIENLVKILEGKNADITKGVKVIVTYTAHLNENANISKPEQKSEPNTNTVKLKYSNNPNVDGESSMGTTVEDENYVFTYGIDNTKYGREADEEDSDKKPLDGAGFKLYKGEDLLNEETEVKLKWDDELDAYRPIKDGEDKEVIKSKNEGKFNIVGLGAGTYTLVEVKTPDGYNTCENVKIKINPQFGGEGSHEITGFDDSNMVNSIVNVHGSRLPDTGSITLIIIFGVAIVLGITGLIISKNKKEE